MSNRYDYPYGAYKTCPFCGKEIFIRRTHDWQFKKLIRKVNGTRETVYFCKYSHKTAWEEEQQKTKEAQNE